MLALRCVMPPRPRGRPLHEVDCRHQGIEHARVLSRLGKFAKSGVEREGVVLDQLCGRLDAEQFKILHECGADVGDLDEARDFASVAGFVDGFHEGAFSPLSRQRPLRPSPTSRVQPV
jgi:hypothetical protein